MPITPSKHRFLIYELGLLSLKAALSTRDKEWPIYDPSKRGHQRSEAKAVLRDLLLEIATRYAEGAVSSEVHIQFIESAANDLSLKLSSTLHKGRFRVGVAQKFINVHLKYLWAAGLIPEPPHCPIDGIIRDIARINYHWTRSDSIEEYRNAVSALIVVASPKSLSVWELEEFRRRAEA